jgi:hypothetical protein
MVCKEHLTDPSNGLGDRRPPGCKFHARVAAPAKLAWRMDDSSISFRDSNSPGSRLSAFKEGLDFVNFSRSERLGFEVGGVTGVFSLHR